MPTGSQPSLPGRKPITIPQHRPVPLHLFCCLHSPELSRDVREVLPSPIPSPEGYTALTCTLLTWEHRSCLCPSCCTVQKDELKAAWGDWSQGWSSTQHSFGTVVGPGAQQAFEEVARPAGLASSLL